MFIGDFIFERPAIVKNNLKVLDNLNDVNFSNWKSNVVIINNLANQKITGKWIIHGNVSIQQNLRDSGLINRTDIHKIGNCINNQRKDVENLIFNKTVYSLFCI
jgi:hypothetical protein